MTRNPIRGEAVDGMDCVQEDLAQDLVDPGDIL
jgi:hypothetical protein